MKEKNERVKRIMRTLDLKDMREMYKFLNKVVFFLAELHFICEFGYVLIRDDSERERDSIKMAISYIVRCIELVIYQTNNILETGKGIDAVERLMVVFNSGLNYIKILNKKICILK
jgi:hypothetical protein